MSGVVVNVCLRVFPMLYQGGYCSIFVGVGGGGGGGGGAADALKR